MKLDKFTKVLINLVLFLAIAILLKYLIIAPRNLYSTSDDIIKYEAETTSAYQKESSKPSVLIYEIQVRHTVKYLQQTIDHMALDGYKLHDIDIELPEYDSREPMAYLIFKR